MRTPVQGGRKEESKFGDEEKGTEKGGREEK